MRILITGGNGFVGRHLVRALLDRADEVSVLTLPQEDHSWLISHGVAVVEADIRQADTISTCFTDVEAVVHLAAMMDVWRPLRDYRTVNVQGTANVASAALAAGVHRFVHMSSSSVYGVTPGRTVDEHAPLAPFNDPYPISKAEGDRLVQRMVVDQGFPAVVLRPDQIFGPGDRLHFGRTAGRVRSGRAIVVGRGNNAVPLVYVSDVVQALLLALSHDQAIGQVFNITNDLPMTQRGFLDAIADELGVRPPGVRVPYGMLYSIAWGVERYAALRRVHRPPVTRLGVAFAGTDVRFSIEKARRKIGFAPQVSIREGVRLTAAWLRHDMQCPA